MRGILDSLLNYLHLFVIPALSISVFYAFQYLTRGISYFFDENKKVRWKYLAFMAGLQFCISTLVTWSVSMAFTSEYLSEYETLKMTCLIVIGSTPFNILILIWVALKLEAYALMKKRYGEEFREDEFFYQVKETQVKESCEAKNLFSSRHSERNIDCHSERSEESNHKTKDVSHSLNMTGKENNMTER